jgi:dephospho-CoA kinase
MRFSAASSQKRSRASFRACSGAQALQRELAAAGIQFGHLDQVAHQIVQLLALVAGRGHQFRLQGEQLSAKALAQRIKAAAQLQQRVAQLAAGYADELRLEAVGVLQTGYVFESGHGTQQPPSESRMGVVRRR